MMSTSSGNTSPQPTLSHLMALRLHHIATHPVSSHVKHKASLCLLDYLGTLSLGLTSPLSSPLSHFLALKNPTGKDASAATKAFINATLAHAAIRDDMHLPSNSHIGSIVISASLALAVRDRWSYGQLLKGVVGGYEAAACLGTSVQQAEGVNRNMRPSGIVGVFGVAAAAVASGVYGNIGAGEDGEVQCWEENTLAFAADSGSGVNQWAWSGGQEIYVQMGRASMNGVMAVDLARSGMKCSDDVLEGRAGVMHALGVGRDGEERFRKWLEDSERETGRGIMEVRFKPAAGCNYIQTPIAVAGSLRKKVGDGASRVEKLVVAVTVGAKRYPGCDYEGPFETVQQTKMSIQFGVSAALVYGSVKEEVFMRFEDDEINRLAKACVVEHAKEYDQDFREGRQPAKIMVHLSDGSKVEEELRDVPWLDEGAVCERFLEEAGPLLGAEKSNKMLEQVMSVHVADIEELISGFRVHLQVS